MKEESQERIVPFWFSAVVVKMLCVEDQGEKGEAKTGRVAGLYL